MNLTLKLKMSNQEDCLDFDSGLAPRRGSCQHCGTRILFAATDFAPRYCGEYCRVLAAARSLWFAADSDQWTAARHAFQRAKAASVAWDRLLAGGR